MTKNTSMMTRSAATAPRTADAERRTVDVIFSTGAQVRRSDWWNGREWLEELDTSEAAMDLARFNGGQANLLDSHGAWSLRSTLGVVERAWSDNGLAMATVRFSQRAEVEPVWRDVVDGILRSVSVGYVVRKFEVRRAARDGELDVYRAVAWEPMEISLVAIPADAGARVRSAESEVATEICEVGAADTRSGAGRPALAHLRRLNENKRRRLGIR